MGKEARIEETDEYDLLFKEFFTYFDLEISINEVIADKFVKIVPVSTRPYGRLYG